MSFIVEVIDSEIKYKFKKRETPYYSRIYKNNSSVIIYSGEFRCMEPEIFFEGPDIKTSEIPDGEAFSIIKIGKNSISFATSKYGVERLYKYWNKEERRFCLSDDFWEMANLFCHGIDSLNVDGIKECINGCYPLLNGSFIKNVEYVEPSVIAKFDLKSAKLIEKTVFEFKYVPDKNLSIKEATERLDQDIDNAFKRIKKECGDIIYSFGLSGGLDSRVIPHYLQKNNMRFNSFIIGDKRPNKFLLSGDHKKARTIASIFNCDHRECKWNADVLKKTMAYDLKNNPMGPPQFFKGQYDTNLDVLITGGNGYIVGSTMPKDIENLSEDDLADSLWNLGRDFKPNKQFNYHVEKAIEVLFKRKISLTHNEEWYHIILDKNSEKRIRSKFKTYIQNEKKKGKSNIDIYEAYFHNILGARNKFGGFESLVGTVRSFSFYTPHVLDGTFCWPLNYLEDRLILKNLIKEKIPEVSEVAEQKYEGNIIKRKSNIIERMIYVFLYIIRGNGSEMINSNFRYCFALFDKDMRSNTKWFYTIFPIEKFLSKIERHDNKYALMKFWKVKLILDLLERSDYYDYLIKDDYITLS